MHVIKYLSTLINPLKCKKKVCYEIETKDGSLSKVMIIWVLVSNAER